MLKNQKTIDSLQIALFVLMESSGNGRKLNEVLREQQMIYQYLPKQERAFLHRLCKGVSERTIELDYVIDCFSKTKTEKMKPVIRQILRMGVYQILYMDKVPDNAACNESVNLAKKKGFYGLSGFVNGVLRTVARNKGTIEYPKKEDAFCQYLSVCFSTPLWLVEYLAGMYGNEIAEKMISSFLEQSETTLRYNRSKISKEQLVSLMEKEGIVVKDGQYTQTGLIVSDYDHMEQIPGFMEGYFQIQDESSILSCMAAGVGKDSLRFCDGKKLKILDLCAAPGGKTLFYSEMVGENGIISARDISEKKMEKIEENMERLGCSNVTVKIQDASETDEEIMALPEKERYDLVVADLPCSGIGVIRRKSDIKSRLAKDDLESLKKLQSQILSVAAKYVKPGGILIYSTCTVNEGENTENVISFLEEHKEFEPFAVRKNLPEQFLLEERNIMEQYREYFSKKNAYLENAIQIFPGLYAMDGFFISGFQKKE